MKKTTILIINTVILSTFINSIKAQTPDDHEKSVYIDKDSTIYWNKALPFYVHLSTSPDADAKKYRMKSKTSSKFADPCYFDTEGVNFIRTKWAVDPDTKKYDYPMHDVLWEIYADSKPPKVSLSVENTNKHLHDGKWYYSKGGKLKITSTDAVAGTKQIYYSLNSKNYSKYKKGINLNEEKDYTLHYYAVDHVGNAGSAENLKFSIDGTAPKTNHKKGKPFHKNIFGKKSKITLETKDKGSGIFYTNYKIDEGKFLNYKGPLYLSWLSEGNHSVTYYSVDNLKNKEEKKTFEFFIDKSVPTVSAEILGDVYSVNGKDYSSGRSRLKLFAVDNKAGVKHIKYRIGNGKWKTYKNPISLKTGKGKININYYAVDNVGNKSLGTGETGMGVKSPYVDLSGPELNYSFEGPHKKFEDSLFISKNTKIKLGASDDETGLKKITYKINNSSMKEYASPFSLKEEGQHNINYKGYDNVNNVNSKKINISVDNTGPKIHKHFGVKSNKQDVNKSGSVNIYPHSTVLFLSATDDKVGYEKIYYSLNGGKEKRYKGEIRDFEAHKNYNVKVRAIDKLGNETIKEFSFGIQ